ncbi:MAG: hypothetical protein IT580_24945, partial [Verrucomicrobiales bacterium]|nr:hypothetical protein [Verrucomicrobiales bacterium]
GPPALSGADSTVTLTVGAALPAGSLLRFLIRGTGPTPLLGADLTPFNHGLDYVHDQPN